ncbi:MAG: adenosylcobinamide-GDP ribazoletransferase [Acidobacteriota bacterium]|nr:MAG: adenosylcobinamide-GDP ribazoletransferase [Acidobacteriota bacterium]
MRRFLAAVAFLTRVPIRTAFTAEDVGRASIFFPVVGVGIGALQFGLWKLTSPHLTSLVVAVAVVTLSAWLTRALHLDGLADFVDGLGGGTRGDVLRIMKDSRIGAFGAIALVLVLCMKIAAIDAMSKPEAFLLAPALARWTPVALGYSLPYARSGRSSPGAHVGKLELAIATIITAGLVVVLGHAVLAGVVVLVSTLVGVIAKRRVGGITGDVLGANIELAETAVLIVATI